ncbi:MAG: GNAT family N-acetyltransferase [Ruminococcaceae bacterium]|nr:GNAT family N-acetyltransferase [Oscillospiraceae bacterium]
MRDISFRVATEADVGKIMEFVRELARFHKMEEGMTVTEELLRRKLFDENRAEVIFALDGEREVGFALYYYNFSSVLGRAGLHLEDLYVMDEYRGAGYGKALLSRLAAIAVEQGCARLEWVCLESNTPSVRFYLGLGAQRMSEWAQFRLDGDALERLADMTR